MSLFDQLQDEMKVAMRAKDKLRLGVIRMAISAIKQVQIDSGQAPDESGCLAVITKMVKQRKDSAAVYIEGGRQELADNELAEITVLEEFLPKQLSAEEIDAHIVAAIAETGAAGVADMGKVMAVLKPVMQGKADLGKVSGLVRNKLA